MLMDKIVLPLLGVPLFQGLKPLQITEIARQAERIRFRRGDIITEAGAQGDGAYLIVAGHAERLDDEGGEGLAEPIEPGSLVGEMAMLVEHDYRATVVALDRVHCLKITRAAIHSQMLDDPGLAEHLQAKITKRLLRMAEDLRQIDRLLADAASAPAASDRALQGATTGSN
ncbi:MAG TPA: cyclic nucleotide-binding domain-containing protein [Hyphomicrobiaceae bacterium]|jgi:CRP-like cAMP-binding protein|nr:cyclic nucleotide-binding domain-containing protein [Hyphomicrobiaceae bacterium]